MNPTSNAASLHSSTNQSQPSLPSAQPSSNPPSTNQPQSSLHSAQPNSNPPSTNQSYPSHFPTQPNSDPPSTNQSQPSVFLAQPNSNTPSTNQSQPFLPSGQPSSNPSLLSRQLTAHPNPSSSQTSVTNSVIQPETSNDETRVAIGVVDQVDLTLPTSECKCVIDLHISYKVSWCFLFNLQFASWLEAGDPSAHIWLCDTIQTVSWCFFNRWCFCFRWYGWQWPQQELLS